MGVDRDPRSHRGHEPAEDAPPARGVSPRAGRDRAPLQRRRVAPRHDGDLPRRSRLDCARPHRHRARARRPPGDPGPHLLRVGAHRRGRAVLRRHHRADLRDGLRVADRAHPGRRQRTHRHHGHHAAGRAGRIRAHRRRAPYPLPGPRGRARPDRRRTGRDRRAGARAHRRRDASRRGNGHLHLRHDRHAQGRRADARQLHLADAAGLRFPAPPH